VLQEVFGVVGVIAGHAHWVAGERFKWWDHVGWKACAQFAIGRVSYVRVEIDSAAYWFGDHAGRECGHRDTIAYPATENATASIASNPYAAFSIVRSFPCVLTRLMWVGLGRRFGECVISCRLLRSWREQLVPVSLAVRANANLRAHLQIRR
jgi:hypothetical protein